MWEGNISYMLILINLTFIYVKFINLMCSEIFEETADFPRNYWIIALMLFHFRIFFMAPTLCVQ